MAALTNHEGHQETTDPLLYHLLDHWFRALGHDSEGVGVGDRSHRGSTQPGHPENGRDASHGDQYEQIEMEAWAFDHLPLRFAHDQPGDSQGSQKAIELFLIPFLPGIIQVKLIIDMKWFHRHVDCDVTHVVIWDSRKMRMKTSSAGTQQAPIIQPGKGFFSPMGLMIQPLALGLVTSTPLGTRSFCKKIKEWFLFSLSYTKNRGRGLWS